MLKTIFERILLSNLGKFVDGIDRENLKLGFWSGDVALTNISLNPQFIQSLELPIKMIYSHVEKLSIQVPWKSIGNAPVEVILENVFLIIEPLEERAWDIGEYRLVLKRLEMIEKYLQMYTGLEIQEEQGESSDKKKKGRNFISKMTKRILDNIQVIIFLAVSCFFRRYFA